MNPAFNITILGDLVNTTPSRADTSKGESYTPIKELDQMHQAEQRAAEVYSAHQDAVIKSGQLTSDITKGIQEGQDPYSLLLKAIECISLMTGDRVFYELNKDNIKNIHGIGLLKHIPIRLELDELQQRLKMLTRPELQDESEDGRTRIERSIKAHEERANYIKSLLEME
ncbi:MAG: hypothetical protein LBU51_04035 [Bacteroidales bacterium]|jgi:hypothetical protein|nr:hypothetical protein [Bacteroidales bacterium]